MRYFLVVYKRSKGRLIACDDLGTDRSVALKQRFAEERRHAGDHDVEVVLLSGASRESVEATHSRYFKTLSQLKHQLST